MLVMPNHDSQRSQPPQNVEKVQMFWERSRHRNPSLQAAGLDILCLLWAARPNYPRGVVKLEAGRRPAGTSFQSSPRRIHRLSFKPIRGVIWEMSVYTAAIGPSGRIHRRKAVLFGRARHQAVESTRRFICGGRPVTPIWSTKTKWRGP